MFNGNRTSFKRLNDFLFVSNAVSKTHAIHTPFYLTRNFGGSIRSFLHFGQRLGFVGRFLSLNSNPQETQEAGSILSFIPWADNVWMICGMWSYTVFSLMPRDWEINRASQASSPNKLMICSRMVAIIN
jgi:hypothetical protein